MLWKKKDDNVNNNDVNVNKDVSITKFEKKKTYLLFRAIIKRFKEDKLYFMSFVITVLFIAVFSLYKVYDAEGLYTHKKNNDEVTDTNVTPSVSPSVDVNETLDVTDYVGIYSREIILDNPVELSDTCTITSYSIVYQIKKDKSISKYFMNDCLGNYLMWKDELSYVSTGGARYISANNVNYLFSASNMKEVDGDAYKLNQDISSIKESKKYKNVDLVFDNNYLILMSYDNLYLINENKIDFELNNEYKNNGGSLKQRVYSSNEQGFYKFIVFSNDEKMNCYNNEIMDSVDFVDGNLYTIYTIKYDFTEHKFGDALKKVTRNKSDGCDNYDDDLSFLTE